MADVKMGRCESCCHWQWPPIYSEAAIKREPTWAAHGLCKHPSSKMHPRWEGAEVIATEPDFGCVQWEMDGGANAG